MKDEHEVRSDILDFGSEMETSTKLEKVDIDSFKSDLDSQEENRIQDPVLVEFPFKCIMHL